MDRKLKNWLGLVIMMWAMPGISAAATLCEADEQVIFSCSIARSQKILSVCGSKAVSDAQGYLQYRFGRVGEVEMTYPSTRINTQKQFKWRTNHHERVVDNWLTFRNGKYTYSVFAIEDHDTKGKRAEYRYGVIIGFPDGKERSFNCHAPVLGKLEMLVDVVPEGDEGQ